VEKVVVSNGVVANRPLFRNVQSFALVGGKGNLRNQVTSVFLVTSRSEGSLGSCDDSRGKIY
jgi:hypothetical protein